MIVSFTTSAGSTYHLDHTNHRFMQSAPVSREGDLFNVPQVVVGKRVQIWTNPPDPSKAAKVIETGVVLNRTVTLD